MKRNLLKEHTSLVQQLARWLDPLVVLGAGYLGYRLYFDSWVIADRYVYAIVGGALVGATIFAQFGLYESMRGQSFVDELRQIVYSWIAIGACWFTFLFATKTGAEFSRLWSAWWIGAGSILQSGVRVSIRLALRSLRRRGYNLRHIVIVGGGQLGREAARRIALASWAGYHVRGFYDDDPQLLGRELDGLPVLGDIRRVAIDVEAGGIDQVWIALPLRAEQQLRTLIDDLQQQSVQIRFVPDIYGFHLLHHSFSEIAGLPVINITDTPLQGINSLAKAIEDYVLSALALIVTSPLMLIIAIGVKLSSRGPVFYRQERITWNGSRFPMLKFRTMPVDAEAASGPVWSQPGEKRATRFGGMLRRMSLDELPQFINVLKGEMSIVGPRPERPQFVAEFRKQIPRYMQKHLVKAGITGWAQVNDLRGRTDLAKRIQYDLYYIENWSIWFDLRIMALTVLNVFRSRHAY